MNTSTTENVFLSEQCSFSMSGSGYFCVLAKSRSTEIWFDALRRDPNSGALFPLHEACIETSCRAIDHVRIKREDIRDRPPAETLCDLLNAHWKYYCKHLDLAHDTTNDIFDLCICCSHYGPRSVLALNRLEWWGGQYDVSRRTV